MSAAWENLNFPTLTVYRLTCLVLQCTLDFRILFPFATCVFLILQVGQISVSFIDDQDLAGHGCPCLLMFIVMLSLIGSKVQQINSWATSTKRKPTAYFFGCSTIYFFIQSTNTWRAIYQAPWRPRGRTEIVVVAKEPAVLSADG